MTLGLEQAPMAGRLGVSLRTYVDTEAGKRPLSGDELETLDRLGFSVDYLLTGRGALRAGDRVMWLGDMTMQLGGPRTVTDAVLLALVIEGVTAVYTQAKRSPAPDETAAAIASIYDGLARLDDEGERRGALKFALDQLRERLLTDTLTRKKGGRK